MLGNKAIKIWSCLFLFRILNSLLVTTVSHPDEFWQLHEPAHNYVFGYGFMTWDWRMKIRSWLFPLPFIILFSLAKILPEPYQTFTVVYGPKILMAFFVSVGDALTLSLSLKLYGPSCQYSTV